MPFIRREDIDPHLRAKHLEARRAQLRQSLLDPSLTVQQVRRIRTEISLLGKPKVYTRDSEPGPGAVIFSLPDS